MKTTIHNDKCRSAHFGPWMIEPTWFSSAVSAVASGTLKAEDKTDNDDEKEGYSIINGIAVIGVAGALMKARSKYGGTSTVSIRQQLRKAVNDDRVESILLVIDSPGGTVAGTDAVGSDVYEANKRKPVYAHIEDLGASAAYWIASQARRVTASATSMVGSLGAMMALVDSSEAHAMNGLKVHLISSGGMKGAGTDGVPIDDDQLGYFQTIVDSATDHFKAAVKRGRGFTDDKTNSLFDGRVHDAAIAKQLGLIDDVVSLDDAVAFILQEIHNMNLEDFNAFATANPDAAKPFIEQGRNAALAELTTPAKAGELKAAFPNDPGFVVDALGDNLTIEQAKAKYADVLSAQLAEANATIADLRKQLESATSGQGAVTLAPAMHIVNPDDIEAVASQEWDRKEGESARFTNKANYVAYRKAVASGTLRVSVK